MITRRYKAETEKDVDAEASLERVARHGLGRGEIAWES